jgi:hypothetical protein
VKILVISADSRTPIKLTTVMTKMIRQIIKIRA